MSFRQVVVQLSLTKEQLKGVVDRFVDGRGLANLPSYIYVDRELKEGEYVVIEMGGTNLRTAKVKLKLETPNQSDRNSDGTRQAGNWKLAYLSDIVKDSIPCREEECSVGVFWRKVIERIKPILEKDARIGFVFSFPMEKTSEVDGKLLYWTKGLKAPQMEGKFVGKEFAKVLNRQGYGACRVVVLNDTVATLLSGLASSPNVRPFFSLASDVVSLVGLVVGTGMNIAIVVNGQVINTECGNLDMARLGLQTEHDRKVDKNSAEPGKNVFEKMISGKYLPLVFNEIVGRERVNSTKDMVDLSGEEGKLAEALFKRSEQLIGAIVAGAVRLSQGPALNNSNIKGWTFNVVAGGSVFWKVPGYKETVEETVRNLGDKGVEVEFLKVDNPGLVGAAIAAALVS